MRQAFLAFCLGVSVANVGFATEPDVVTKGMVKPGWLTYRYNIKWGIKTKTKQVWDGHAELDRGSILNVTPYIRHEMPCDAMIVSHTSWRSTTYRDVEGIYLTVYAPADAMVTIHTVTHDLRFEVGGLVSGESREALNGDIRISNETEEILFRIAGLEKGAPGKGTATITPTEARAATVGTLTITYTAPEGGLPIGGGVRISWHFTRTWGEPQFTDPKAKNYVTARTTGRCRLDYTSEHRGLFEYPFGRGRILVRVLDEPLAAGEQIVVTLGDTSEGSPGFEAPVIAEQRTVIRVEDCTEVPEGGFPVYRRLVDLPSVTVHAERQAHRLFVVAPSEVQVGAPFELRLVVEDRFRNVVPDFAGELEIRVGGTQLRQVRMNAEDRGTLLVPELQLSDAGPQLITVRQLRGAVSGESNPIRCRSQPAQSLLVWGELHGHTQYSDGYGSADDYFSFARCRALLDFAAITDHDVELDAPDYHVADMWREVNDGVVRHHDPPRFCTIPAYEWSPAGHVTLTTTAPFGDHNIYYAREGMPIFKAEDANANTLPKLYDHLEHIGKHAVQVIPHVGGAIANWEYHHPGLENLGEIFSVHGSFEGFGEIALQRGYTVGFVGAADSHNGQVGGFPPGNATGHYTHGGLTAVIVPELSREALLDAFRARHVYATTGVRTLVDFRVNGAPMGRVIKADRTPTITADVIGSAPLLSVEVVKNGRVIHTWRNQYLDDGKLTILWGNRVEQADLLDFDSSLWSQHLRYVDWAGYVRCVSGRLTLDRTRSFDYSKDSILSDGPEQVVWTSQTRGDWDGVALRVDPLDTTLALRLGLHELTVQPATLDLGMNPRKLGDSDRVLIVRGSPRARHAAFEIMDHTILNSRNYYYLRVLQADGEMAWSSPVWIERSMGDIE